MQNTLRGEAWKALGVLCILGAQCLAGPPVVESGAGPSDWEPRRKELVARWQRILGELPREKAPLELTVVSQESLPGFDRRYVRYQVEAGVWTDGYLLVPNPLPKSRVPGVIVFHSTVKEQAQLVAGVASSEPEKQQGVQMALAGYVALCPRNFLFNEGADFQGNTAEVLRTWHTGMARMLWDGIRAADVLASLPEVDSERLGCIGHSLGAKEALYLAAFDERIQGAVFSEGGIGLRMSNWEALWYLGPQVKAPEFSQDHEDLIALIAPRSFLVLAGDSADTDAGNDYLRAARPVYARLGAESRLRFFNHRLGHRYPPEARAVAEAFLREALGP